MYTLGNNHAYKLQEAYQKTIGSPGIAKALAKVLKGKDECVVVYTNNQRFKIQLLFK